jgi:hypothetical protein
MPDICTCSVCGEAVGVYERVFVIGEGLARRTSLAREPHLVDDGAMVIHGSCGPRVSGPRHQLLIAAGLTAGL